MNSEAVPASSRLTTLYPSTTLRMVPLPTAAPQGG
jgi:hypothetical protein